MTVTSDTAIDHTHTATMHVDGRNIRSSLATGGRFLFHLLEMIVAMMVGMALLYGLDVLSPETARYAAFFKFGTNPFDLAMGMFMTVPMVGWMLVRGHGRRHSAEMALAMLAPVAAILVLRQAGAEDYLPWLDYAGHAVMLPAMLIAMLYRRDHFSGKAGHGGHAAHGPHG
ncbi:MAG: hypothetical protein RRC07_15780 [Anaerolineae bacterium]|nr:hypothetical protein [Anaerolineae bacterium]